MNWPEITAMLLAIVAFGGMLAQWRNGRTQRLTGDASAAKDIAEAYENLKETLEARVDDLERKLIAAEVRAVKAEERATKAEVKADRIEQELNYCLAGVRILISQITSATGEKPLWKPKDYMG